MNRLGRKVLIGEIEAVVVSKTRVDCGSKSFPDWVTHVDLIYLDYSGEPKKIEKVAEEAIDWSAHPARLL